MGCATSVLGGRGDDPHAGEKVRHRLARGLDHELLKRYRIGQRIQGAEVKTNPVIGDQNFCAFHVHERLKRNNFAIKAADV